MTVESAIYIDTLNAANPGNGDAVAEGDQHLRMLKSVLQATFPNDPTSDASYTDWDQLTGAATAWSAITKPAGFSDVTNAVAKCAKIAGRVWLTGIAHNTSAGSVTSIGTVPVGFRPLQAITLPIALVRSGNCVGEWINISSSGAISLSVAISNGDKVYYFGVSYDFASYN